MTSLGYWLPVLYLLPSPSLWALGKERAHPVPIPPSPTGHLSRAAAVVASCSPSGVLQGPHLVSSSGVICLGDIRVPLPLPS